MYHLLYKYLVLNKEVGLPGIGEFILEKEPARLDPDSKVIHAPLPVVKFKSQPTAYDNNFYVFLSRELNIDVTEATIQLQNFASKLKREVEIQKWVDLPGMGTLTPGVRDEIKFKTAPVLKEYYPSIAVEKVLQTEVAEPATTVTPQAEPEPVLLTEEQEEVLVEEMRKRKSFWWVFAIILALIGAAAIIYYYYYLQPQPL